MPLTEKEVGILHELYQVPFGNTTVFSSGVATAENLVGFDYQVGVREQLHKAIDFINADEAIVSIIQEILAEYEDFRLDPSKIDRDGYQFRAGRNKRAIYQALYPYTGIVMNHQRKSKRIR